MKTSDEYRPILRIKPSKTDYAIEGIAFLCLAAIWVLPAIAFQSLPETVPTHYGLSGKADDWGSKNMIFILPAISILIYTGMSIVNRFPHNFNYPAKVTPENALLLYTRATRLIRILKALAVILFLSIEWSICRGDQNSHLPAWLLPAVLVCTVLLPIIMAFALTGKGQKKT